MKLSRAWLAALGLCSSTGTVLAGGLLIPGAGAVSTSRAGASTAAADGVEAISLNPAGIAKTKGTVITLGFTAINYAMSFHRNGRYDDNAEESEPYEGQRYPIIENNSKPALGIGPYLPVPAVGVVSDLGGAVPNFHLGFGLYTTNAYPDRNMNYVDGQPFFVPDSDTGGYRHPAVYGEAPPPTRYDIIEQEAVILMPALVAAYSLPVGSCKDCGVDIGVRFQAGFAHLKSTVAVWGGLANYGEEIRKDGVFTLDAKDSFVFGGGLGVNYRPSNNLEFGLHYNAPVQIQGRGDAHADNGPGVNLDGQPIDILPVDDSAARCATGGTMEFQKGCVELALPMSAVVGARYKLLDAKGELKGDIELDLAWENWGMERAGEFRVVVDAQIATRTNPDNGINLKDNIVRHGLRDTYGVRLGGSYHIPVGDNTLITRGGLGYETGAAKPGWERADFDGAARTTISAGASYKLPRVQFDLGFGVALQGTREDSRTCNPALNPTMQPGCGPNDELQPIADRQGPDPANPLLVPASQAENPVNQGTFTSHYLMFMLGASTWF